MKNYIYLLLVLFLFSCNEKKKIDLGRGYRFDYDPIWSEDYMIFGINKNIFGNIISFDFDSIYIIVQQKPREIILKNTFNNPEITYRKQEQIFKESTLRQYWIINKINNITYGPYTKEEFQQKREELGVPKKLQLKE